MSLTAHHAFLLEPEKALAKHPAGKGLSFSSGNQEHSEQSGHVTGECAVPVCSPLPGPRSHWHRVVTHVELWRFHPRPWLLPLSSCGLEDCPPWAEGDVSGQDWKVSEGGGGSHQSRIRKEPDRWGVSAGLVLTVVYSLPAHCFSPAEHKQP